MFICVGIVFSETPQKKVDLMVTTPMLRQLLRKRLEVAMSPAAKRKIEDQFYPYRLKIRPHWLALHSTLTTTNTTIITITIHILIIHLRIPTVAVQMAALVV